MYLKFFFSLDFYEYNVICWKYIKIGFVQPNYVVKVKKQFIFVLELGIILCFFKV